MHANPVNARSAQHPSSPRRSAGRSAVVASAPRRDPTFPPSRFTALRRTLMVHPERYAHSRNHLDGAVTALSPYVTHGVISAREVHALWHARHGLSLDDALPGQLAWRAFFHHVRAQRGEAILDDLGAAPAGRAYRPTLPADIVSARTGVPVIDASVRQLYATGWLHNHQRLWLASYCVHLRKVHWRVGADWMYGHLLDGDLACNHLSWQWVAGTFSSRPYLFNADHVARFAPGLASPGTAIDTDYDTLARIAHEAVDVGPSRRRVTGVAAPPLLARPPQRPALADCARLVRGRRVALVHPWDLARRPDAQCALGVVLLPFHARFRWSAQRWAFVLGRMRRICDAIWIGRPAHLAIVLDGCSALHTTCPPEPDYVAALSSMGVSIEDTPPWLPAPDTPVASFSAYRRFLLRAHPELFGRRD